MGTGVGDESLIFVAFEGLFTVEERLEFDVAAAVAEGVCWIFNKLGICGCWDWGWDSCSRNWTKAWTKLSLECEPGE